MRTVLEFCLGMASLMVSFVGSYLLLLWGVWCSGCLVLLGLALVRGTSGLPPGAPDAWTGATPWAWTLLGLVGAVTKRAGDRVARWVYRDALIGVGGAERSAPPTRCR